MCCGVCSTLRSSALLAHANTVRYAASSAASTRCLISSATCRCPAACLMIGLRPAPAEQTRSTAGSCAPPSQGRAPRAALLGTWRRWRSRPVRLVVPPRSRPGLAQVLRLEILFLKNKVPPAIDGRRSPAYSSPLAPPRGQDARKICGILSPQRLIFTPDIHLCPKHISDRHQSLCCQ